MSVAEWLFVVNYFLKVGNFIDWPWYLVVFPLIVELFLKLLCVFFL